MNAKPDYKSLKLNFPEIAQSILKNFPAGFLVSFITLFAVIFFDWFLHKISQSPQSSFSEPINHLSYFSYFISLIKLLVFFMFCSPFYFMVLETSNFKQSFSFNNLRDRLLNLRLITAQFSTFIIAIGVSIAIATIAGIVFFILILLTVSASGMSSSSGSDELMGIIGVIIIMALLALPVLFSMLLNYFYSIRKLSLANSLLTSLNVLLTKWFPILFISLSLAFISIVFAYLFLLNNLAVIYNTLTGMNEFSSAFVGALMIFLFFQTSVCLILHGFLHHYLKQVNS